MLSSGWADAMERVALGTMPSASFLFLAFALGVLFAAAGRDDLRRHDEPLAATATWIVLLFSVLYFAPSATTLMLRNPAWGLSYWIEPATLPAWFPALLALCYAAAPLLGFLAAAPSASRGRDSTMVAMALSAAVIALALAVFSLPRLLVDGTYRQYHQSFGLRSIAGSPLGHTLMWAVLTYVAVVAWTLSLLRNLRPRTSNSDPLLKQPHHLP